MTKIRIPPFAPTIKGYPNGYPLIVGLVIEGIRRAVKKTVQRTVFPPWILCQAAVRGMECKQRDADDKNPSPPIRTKAMGAPLWGVYGFGYIMEGIRSRGRTVAKTL